MMMLHVTQEHANERERKRVREKQGFFCHQPYNAVLCKTLSFLSLQEATGLRLPDVAPRSGSFP